MSDAERAKKMELVRAELKEVSARHDVAIIAMAVTPGILIHSLILEASWNCVELGRHEGDPDVRFNSMRFPEDQRQQVVADTASMILGLSDANRFLGGQLDQLQACLAEKFAMAHTSRMFSSKCRACGRWSNKRGGMPCPHCGK